ncbi:MAG: hypothetical protein ACOVT5_00070 [Armatimonadaceae bacterium]
MFRRAWWTRRRIVIAAVLAVLIAGGVVWECGTDEVREGQPLDEAKAALLRAGGVDSTKNCGMYCSVGRHYEVSNSYWQLPDGRTLYLVGTRESDAEPFRVDRIMMWQGWYKPGGIELPPADSVQFRRSVLAIVTFWMR